ncbi:hypothetical protein Ahy_A01g001663 [Arachis hypogaea]|uniref:Lysophospholipid acyltransferase n=1 Tax=Arachis hypogaea TaxID=3818 RepID=A0A445EP24_ARAHY|nr:hypothetical protein Ahy_A01g001663 [Arachis hypogaea]
MAMEVELEPMAASIGVTVPVLRFLLCFAATVPLSFLWRIVPGLLPKHLYSTGIGVSLSYIFFGLSSNMHFLVLIMVGYSFLLLLRPRCGILTFFLGFGYLIGCHVYYMSGDDTVYDFLTVIEGHVYHVSDIEGGNSVVLLTYIYIWLWGLNGVDPEDHLLLLKEEEGLREAQRKYRLTKLPFLVEYIGYCLCCMTHFAGSVFEMKDNLDWTEGKGIWSKEAKRPSPLPYGATIRALIQADFCMALYLYLVPYFPLSRFTEPIYQEWAFWKKFGYQYMSGFTACWKSFYYHLWSWLVNSSPPKPRWDRAKNVDILGVEFAKSSVVIPTVWNIQVSTWLRRCDRTKPIFQKFGMKLDLVKLDSEYEIVKILLCYRLYFALDVYERLVQSGKKPGFFQLLATQTISAIWHNCFVVLGVYPGYIIFFVQSALMIAGSRGNTLE